MLDFIILRNKGKQIGNFITSRINLNIFRFTSYALLHLLVDFFGRFRSFPIFQQSFRWYQTVEKKSAILALRFYLFSVL